MRRKNPSLEYISEQVGYLEEVIGKQRDTRRRKKEFINQCKQSALTWLVILAASCQITVMLHFALKFW